MTTGVEAPGRPSSRAVVVDRMVTIVLLVLLLGVVCLASMLGFFFSFATDSCGVEHPCRDRLITAGIALAALGPWGAWLAALVGSVVLMARRRIACWAPVVGAVGLAMFWLAGAALVSAGQG